MRAPPRGCLLSQIENYDMKFVGPKTWDKLVSWYGGGPAFPRTVVLRGYQESLEIFPQPCKLRRTLPSGEPGTETALVLIPRASKTSDILQKCCAELGVPTASSRLWMKVQARLFVVRCVGARGGITS